MVVASVTVVGLLLTVLLARSWAPLPRWRRGLAELRPAGMGWLVRVVLPTAIDLSWPLAVAGLTLLEGALRSALAWTAMRRPRGA